MRKFLEEINEDIHVGFFKSPKHSLVILFVEDKEMSVCDTFDSGCSRLVGDESQFTKA